MSFSSSSGQSLTERVQVGKIAKAQAVAYSRAGVTSARVGKSAGRTTVNGVKRGTSRALRHFGKTPAKFLRVKQRVKLPLKKRMKLMKKRFKGLKKMGGGALNGFSPSSLSTPLAAGNAQERFAQNASRYLTQSLKMEAKAAKMVAKSPYKAYKGTRAAIRGVKKSIAATKRMAAFIRHMVQMIARIGTMAATAFAPVLLILVAIVASVTLLGSVFSSIMGFMNSSEGSVSGVPSEYEAIVIRAGSICQPITPALIAAQVQQESGFNPRAASPVGAQGISQFMPATWTAHGKDADGDGKADIMNPQDAIYSQGAYMCELASNVQNLIAQGKASGDVTDLALAAYNAGLGNVVKYKGIPPFKETQNYVKTIKANMANYTQGLASNAVSVGELAPPLKIASGRTVDIAAMGIAPRSTTYEVYQCTWWADQRRKQIGRKTDPFMGNGGDWDNTARKKGWSVSQTPHGGDAIVFEPGVHGSHKLYGHVAVVEKVNADGSILISQSGVGFGRVVTETISSTALNTMRGGISYVE